MNQAYREQDFDENGHSEDLYGRLCILAHTSVRQVLRTANFDCDYDDRLGLTATYDIAGQTRTIKVLAKRIAELFVPNWTDTHFEGMNTRVHFAALDTDLRSQVEDLRSQVEDLKSKGVPSGFHPQ
jgi:hypothetical protein